MKRQFMAIAVASVAAFIACDAAIGQSTATSNQAAARSADAPAGPAALDLGDCPDNAGNFEIAKSYVCSCPPSAADGTPAGPVYGSLLYTNDSNICAAAIHAGVLKAATAGRVVVQMTDSPPVFKSTTQNGVKSEVWASATAAAFQFTLPARS